MADPNRTPPQKERNPQDEDLFRQEGERQRLRRERGRSPTNRVSASAAVARETTNR